MAKITLSDEYSNFKGKTGDLVIYKWKGKDCCRIYVIPRNPKTRAQKANRRLFAEASISWRKLSTETRNLYDFRALKHKTSLSGFNLYVSDYMKGKINTGVNETDPVPGEGVIPVYSLSSPDPLRMSSIPGKYMLRHWSGKRRRRKIMCQGMRKAS